jgi:adenine nucleotide transporter 17
LKGLYAGLGSDTLATVLSSFIYFYCYTALRNVQEKLNTNMGKNTATLNVAQELFLGAEAALISRFFTTPVSNVTTRLQTAGGSGSSGKKQKGFKEIAAEILKEKGITGFWTGKVLLLESYIDPTKRGFFFSLLNNRIPCFHYISFKSFHYILCIRKDQIHLHAYT